LKVKQVEPKKQGGLILVFSYRLFFVTNFNFQSCPASPEAGP